MRANGFKFGRAGGKMRSRFLFVAAIAAVSLLVTTTARGTDPITQGSITISLKQFISPVSFNQISDGSPLDFVSAGDGSGRIYVPTRNGKIDVFNSSGQLLSTYLNMPADGINIYHNGEGGLLGMAFSPNFNAPVGTPGRGKFYTFDTEPFNGTVVNGILNGPAADFSSPELYPTTNVAPNNQIVIREWSVASGGAVNPTSRVLLTIDHPEDNHQGGALRFGPDGYLYIGLGDGGGGNDAFPSPSTTVDGHNNAIGNGQDTMVPFGKILRIDPNGSNSANGQYGIPSTNPFADGSGRNLREIYAYGFRNPYRFNFDSATGDLWIGDVGQTTREEIDKIADNTPGGNYGWPFKEGTATGNSGRTTPNGFSSIDPVGEYFHDTSGGEAVIGGYIYQGSDIPDLDGMYVFGDLGGILNNQGKLFYMDPSTGAINSFRFASNSQTIPTTLYGFGQDDNGEIYAMFSDGAIMELVPEPGGLVLAGLGAVVCGAELARLRALRWGNKRL